MFSSKNALSNQRFENSDTPSGELIHLGDSSERTPGSPSWRTWRWPHGCLPPSYRTHLMKLWNIVMNPHIERASARAFEQTETLNLWEVIMTKCVWKFMHNEIFFERSCTTRVHGGPSTENLRFKPGFRCSDFGRPCRTTVNYIA